MTVGDRIKAARTAAKLTQKELAKNSGVAEITIRQYESNKRQPKFEFLAKLAKALNTTPLELYEGADILDKLEQTTKNFELLIKPGEIEHDLLDTFWKLNEKGGKVALERLKELTEISRYTEHSEN